MAAKYSSTRNRIWVVINSASTQVFNYSSQPYKIVTQQIAFWIGAESAEIIGKSLLDGTSKRYLPVAALMSMVQSADMDKVTCWFYNLPVMQFFAVATSSSSDKCWLVRALSFSMVYSVLFIQMTMRMLSQSLSPSYKELILIKTYLRSISITTVYIRDRKLKSYDRSEDLRLLWINGKSL